MRKYLGPALLMSMFGTAALADAPTPDPCTVPAEPKKPSSTKPKKPKAVVQKAEDTQPAIQNNNQQAAGNSATVTNEINVTLIYEGQDAEDGNGAEQGGRLCPLNAGAAAASAGDAAVKAAGNAVATANASAQASASSRQDEAGTPVKNDEAKSSKEEPKFLAQTYGSVLNTGEGEGSAVLGFSALLKGFLFEKMSLGFGGEGWKMHSPSSESIGARTGNLFVRYADAFGERTDDAESGKAFSLEFGTYRDISPVAPGNALSLSNVRTDHLLQERYYQKTDDRIERPGNFVGGRAGLLFESMQKEQNGNGSAFSVAAFGGRVLKTPDWVAGAEVEGVHADGNGLQARARLTALHNSAADRPYYVAGTAQGMLGVIGDWLSVEVNAEGESNLRDANVAAHAGLAVHPVNWMTVHGTAGRRWGDEANIGTVELGAALGPVRLSAGLRLEKPEDGRTRTGGQLSLDLRL